MWDQTRHALEFFQKHLPFWSMWPANDLVDDECAYVFAREGDIYAVYLPEAGRVRVTIAPGAYSLEWYDPRNGGALQTGSRKTVRAGEMQMRSDGAVALSPPSHPGKDWVALLKKLPVPRGTAGE